MDGKISPDPVEKTYPQRASRARKWDHGGSNDGRGGGLRRGIDPL